MTTKTKQQSGKLSTGIKVIITGTTGFVGEGVLLECIKDPRVKQILMINRRSYPIKHPKVKELVLKDFFKIDQFSKKINGYDACFYCVGISSSGMDEKAYSYITYDTTIHFAKVLALLCPDMIFNFVSGRSTDTTGQGKQMWARVKGKTELELGTLPFAAQYNFRPGYMKPTHGQKNVKTAYKLLGGIWPFLFPKQSCKMNEVGLAMINTATDGYPKKVLEIADIKESANN
jgi:hypothetical protein